MKVVYIWADQGLQYSCRTKTMMKIIYLSKSIKVLQMKVSQIDVYLPILFRSCLDYWLNRFLLLISILTVFMAGSVANFEYDLKDLKLLKSFLNQLF